MKYTGLNINDKIKSYFEQKKELDKQQRNVLQLSKDIKEYLISEDLSEYDSDDLTVSISEISKDTIDEENLIPLLKESFPNVVKLKEYIDMDELENLVYTRQIPPDFIQSFIIHKEPTIRLNIKQRKENENV